MQINVPGEIPIGAFSEASPIILPVPIEKYHLYVKREGGEWEKHLNVLFVIRQVMHSSMCMKLLLADPNSGKWFIPSEYWKVSIKSVANKK